MNFAKCKSDHVNRLIKTMQCYPRNARISGSVKHHINRLKGGWKNDKIISADTEKAFNKIQIKTLGKLEIEVNFLNLIKGTSIEPLKQT